MDLADVHTPSARSMRKRKERLTQGSSPAAKPKSKTWRKKPRNVTKRFKGFWLKFFLLRE